MNTNPLRILKIWLEGFLNIFFPLGCLGCGRQDQAICDNCLKNTKLLKNDECPFCLITGSLGLVCKNCSGKYFLDGLFYVNYYEDNQFLTKAIWKLKFKGMVDYAQPLAKLLKRRLKLVYDCFSDLKNCYYCPIPSDLQKIKKRGFNQTQLLLNLMDINTDLQMKCLICQSGFKDQKTLDSKQRKIQIKNKFMVKTKLKGEKIILIDDIATSLATLEEAARVLKRAGAAKIYGLVLLRQKLRNINFKS